MAYIYTSHGTPINESCLQSLQGGKDPQDALSL